MSVLSLHVAAAQTVCAHTLSKAELNATTSDAPATAELSNTGTGRPPSAPPPMPRPPALEAAMTATAPPQAAALPVKKRSVKTTMATGAWNANAAKDNSWAVAM
mmetsp:Transcript_96213/g.294290  ORF Transcript_96213/g.294290 Transcript_96213/m.294290 type:complete len:104 (-) Transcript_96213:23-334(-)